jgi:hypothetical protein
MALSMHLAFGTALTADRSTVERDGRLVSLTVDSNVVIYAGAMVCENGSAEAVPAADASGYACIGKAVAGADNTGANYSATKTVEVARGIFRWANGGSFTDANIGDLAYVADDQTVTTAGSATYDIVAGVIIDVDASGVWVDTYAIGGSGAAALTTLTTSGNAAVGGALAVTGNGTFSAALTVTDADGAAVATATGYEANDATMVLDADQGDDNADTWIVESEAADNDLSFVNHTTEAFKVSAVGDAKSTGDMHALGGDVYLGTVGNLAIANTTQLVFIASGVTNVLDADITN